MAKVTITNQTPHKRVTRGKNGKGGKPRRKCLVCGRPISGQYGKFCRVCFLDSTGGGCCYGR